MELSRLAIRNFRNLREVELKPGPRFNVLSGMNGQGKTNLLEAVYILGAVKSLRAQRNGDLIAWGEKKAVVAGEIVREGQHRSARVEVARNGKRVYLSDMLVRNLSEFFGTLSSVVFSPDDLMMLKGGPSERRRFVDRAVFNARAGYLADVQAYEAVLKQRNAILKKDNPAPVLLEVYDEQLADYGAQVTSSRLRYLAEFEPLFFDTFRQIFAGDQGAEPLLGAEIAETVAMAYAASWIGDGSVAVSGELPDKATLEVAMTSALKSSLTDDIRRGFTTVGPHRDDLSLTLLDRDARSFASQGQMRAMVLAMKIAEIRVLTERFGNTPVLLLDDVSSELDRFRNRHLFEMLERHPGQVFITTTHRSYIALEGDVASFEVRAGQVERVD